MNNQSLNSSYIPGTGDDDWVISSKSLHAGGFVVEHQIEPPDEIEIGKVNHHIIGYLLNDFAPRQITRLDSKEYDSTFIFTKTLQKNMRFLRFLIDLVIRI